MDIVPILTYLTSHQRRLAFQKEAHPSRGLTMWKNDGGGGVRQMIRVLECQTKPSGPSLVCLGAIDHRRSSSRGVADPATSFGNGVLAPAACF